MKILTMSEKWQDELTKKATKKKHGIPYVVEAISAVSPNLQSHIYASTHCRIHKPVMTN